MEICISEYNEKKIVVLLDNEMKIVKPVYDYLRFQQQKDRATNTLKAYGSRFTFETPVGIWRLDTTRTPYRIQHINTAMNPNNRITFHNQPRLFYSLKDVFDYVKRHDDHLLAVSMGGTA